MTNMFTQSNETPMKKQSWTQQAHDSTQPWALVLGSYIQGTFEVCSHIRSPIMGAETVPKVLFLLTIWHGWWPERILLWIYMYRVFATDQPKTMMLEGEIFSHQHMSFEPSHNWLMAICRCTVIFCVDC